MRLFILIVLAASYALAADADVTQEVNIEKDSGRFVFKRFGNIRADTYMIDTKTGRLWILAKTDEKNKDLPAFVLEPIPYEDIVKNDSLHPILPDVYMELDGEISTVQHQYPNNKNMGYARGYFEFGSNFTPVEKTQQSSQAETKSSAETSAKP